MARPVLHWPAGPWRSVTRPKGRLISPTQNRPQTTTIHEAETTLGNMGRVLVRYSGTENICRVMVEGPRQKQVNTLAKTIADAVVEEIGLKTSDK